MTGSAPGFRRRDPSAIAALVLDLMLVLDLVFVLSLVLTPVVVGAPAAA
jgi:hypothetical protein